MNTNYDYPTDLKVVKITYAPITGRSPKMIGKNAVRDNHGITGSERLLRVFTNQGHEGIGVARGRIEEVEAEAKLILGKNPFDFFEAGIGMKLKALEFPLWDLVGKVLKKPIYQLLGGNHRDSIEAYDGALYLADLLYPERGIARLEEEAIESVLKGFKGIKMKIGRGAKWMEKEAGLKRDVEAVKAVRKAIGKEITLLVDANNGYTKLESIRLFEEIGAQDILWAEEMFRENIEECLEFKEFFKARGWKTLVADGEGGPNTEFFRPFLEAGTFEVVQADMNHLGYTEYMRLAKLAEECKITCAPHTWGSQFGLFASLHLAKAIPNFLSAEVPAYEHDAYIAVGIDFQDGSYTVSDMPGFGIVVNERAYNEHYRAGETSYEL